MSNIDRRMIANYFKPFPTWTIWCIVIGILLTPIAVGLLPLAIGIIGLTALKRPTDEQMDQWWQEELEELKKIALEKLNIDFEECVSEPEIVWGPCTRLPLQIKAGRDKVIRFNPIEVSIINFGEHQLLNYKVFYDRSSQHEDGKTGGRHREETDEYFYKDVVSVATKTDTTRHSVEVKGDPQVHQVVLEHSEVFRMTNSGAQTIEVFLGDEALMRLQRTRNGTFERVRSRADNAVRNIRRMLREKKAVPA